MRVIAGKARSLPLITPEGMETRPTTDRIRETLFNMLQPELADSRFLDLFSGSDVGHKFKKLPRQFLHVFSFRQHSAVKVDPLFLVPRKSRIC